jgi:hypothetical protein
MADSAKRIKRWWIVWSANPLGNLFYWVLQPRHRAGFALADEVQSSGLVDVPLDFLEDAPYLAIAPAVGLLSIFTEFITSNDDITTLIIQLLYHIARTMHYACTSSSSNDPRSNCNWICFSWICHWLLAVVLELGLYYCKIN